MMWRNYRHGLTTLGVATARPAAFAVFLAYAALWLVLDLGSLDWHAIATLATWFMTLVIQRAEHRDTQALHAKLDELLRADKGARTELVGIDDEEPEIIEERRAASRRKDRHST
jgi:low affinity Fe/Cu permease